MPGLLDENIFQGWFGDGHRIDLSRKCFHQLGDELMSTLVLEPDSFPDEDGFGSELFFNLEPKLFRLSRLKDDDVAADLSFERLWESERDQLPPVQDGQPVASFRFLHEVCRQEDRDPILLFQFSEMLAEIPASSWIKSSGRLVEQQQIGAVEESFSEFNAPAKAVRKFLGHFVGTFGQTDAKKQFLETVPQSVAAKTIKMSLLVKVFPGGQLSVETLRLKYHADALPNARGSLGNIVAKDSGLSPGGSEQGGENPENGSFASAIGPEKAKGFSWLNHKTNFMQCDPITVLVSKTLD